MARSTLSARFGARVRTLRTARDLSQFDLAAAVGLSPNHLGVLERGEKMPTLETAEALAKALNLSVAELLSDEGGADPWLDELRSIGAGVPPDLRALALEVLSTFAKRRRRARSRK
jgi:transcriptional regulator with XRE-family HTH domain